MRGQDLIDMTNQKTVFNCNDQSEDSIYLGLQPLTQQLHHLVNQLRSVRHHVECLFIGNTLARLPAKIIRCLGVGSKLEQHSGQ